MDVVYSSKVEIVGKIVFKNVFCKCLIFLVKMLSILFVLKWEESMSEVGFSIL